METENTKNKSEFKAQFQKRLVYFTVNTLKLCGKLREERNLWAVADQLVRSASSVGANVSEAKGSGSLRGYKNYFEIALKSANETNYWFTVIAEYQGKDNSSLNDLRSELSEIIKILSTSIITMKGQGRINNF